MRFLSQYHIHDIDRFKWKSRALFNPALHKQVLYGFMNKFNCKGDLLLEKLKAKANGNTEIKLLDEFNHATLDIIGTVINLLINQLEMLYNIRFLI